MQSPYISSINALSNEEKAIKIIENNLYIPGWALYDEAQSVMFGCYRDEDCFIHFAGSTDIYGVVVVTCGTVNVFVKSEYRRNKVGSYLMEQANAFLPKEEMFYGKGIDGSEHFWESIFNMVN